MEVDSVTHFSRELLCRPPTAAQEIIPVYAAILVNAMGLDGTDVAMMIPGVRLSAVRRAAMLLEEETALRPRMTWWSRIFLLNHYQSNGATVMKPQAT
jgi:hypothetical protein